MRMQELRSIGGGVFFDKLLRVGTPVHRKGGRIVSFSNSDVHDWAQKALDKYQWRLFGERRQFERHDLPIRPA